MPDVAAQILHGWSGSRRDPLYERAARLLDQLALTSSAATLPLGKRDLHLLQARRLIAPGPIECEVECPKCSEALELVVPVASLEQMFIEPAPVSVELGEGLVEVRPVETTDLRRVSASSDADGARALAESVADRRELEPSEVSTVLAALPDTDPFAWLSVPITCPDCAHRWESAFSLLQFVADDLDRWTRTLLDDVHHLARAYGWTEAEILSIPAARRQQYLERIQRG